MNVGDDQSTFQNPALLLGLFWDRKGPGTQGIKHLNLQLKKHVFNIEKQRLRHKKIT